MWIGMTGVSNTNAIPKTWTSDNSPVDFNAFWDAGPVLGEGLILSHLPDNGWRGHWFNHNLTTYRHPPLCMREALPGAPDLELQKITEFTKCPNFENFGKLI